MLRPIHHSLQSQHKQHQHCPVHRRSQPTLATLVYRYWPLPLRLCFPPPLQIKIKMPHAKTDSEVTSLAPSSPPRSPPRTRPVYYVQSPSRDSHDGDKTATSVHSTPALSPMASPRHSHSSVGRDSSSSRFSGHPKRSGSKAGDKAAGRKGAPQGKGWQEIGDKAAECVVDSACENEYPTATPQGRRLRAHRRNSGQGKITIEEEERT